MQELYSKDPHHLVEPWFGEKNISLNFHSRGVKLIGVSIITIRQVLLLMLFFRKGGRLSVSHVYILI